MKAAPDVQLRLLDLQEVDTTLDRLNHRRRTLPELAEIDALTARADELRDQVVTAETELSDVAREQTKAEADVDQVRVRAERDRKRLDAGQVSSPKELENLQSEIDSLGRRQSELEDGVLEIMERREAAEARRAERGAEHDRVTGELSVLTDKRDAAQGEIDAELAQAGGGRDEIAKEIPGDVLALYERLRGQYGTGAAALKAGRCEGCKLALSTVDLNEIRASADDEVTRCPECRRILVRTPESGL